MRTGTLFLWVDGTQIGVLEAAAISTNRFITRSVRPTGSVFTLRPDALLPVS